MIRCGLQSSKLTVLDLMWSPIQQMAMIIVYKMT